MHGIILQNQFMHNAQPTPPPPPPKQLQTKSNKQIRSGARKLFFHLDKLLPLTVLLTDRLTFFFKVLKVKNRKHHSRHRIYGSVRICLYACKLMCECIRVCLRICFGMCVLVCDVVCIICILFFNAKKNRVWGAGCDSVGKPQLQGKVGKRLLGQS